MSGVEITTDGWIVDEPWLFQKLFGHSPPRAYSYWDQVRQDAKSWIILSIWFAIAAGIVLAIFLGWYILFVPSFFLLYKWCILCSVVVSNFRNSPVTSGVLDGATISHPLGNAIVGRPQMATADLADGRIVSLSISDSLVQAAFRTSEKAEVLFLDNPRDEFPLAIGVRPIPKVTTDGPIEKEEVNRVN